MLKQRCLTALLTACYSALRVHQGLLKEMTVSSIVDRTAFRLGTGRTQEPCGWFLSAGTCVFDCFIWSKASIGFHLGLTFFPYLLGFRKTLRLFPPTCGWNAAFSLHNLVILLSFWEFRFPSWVGPQALTALVQNLANSDQSLDVSMNATCLCMLALWGAAHLSMMSPVPQPKSAGTGSSPCKW